MSPRLLLLTTNLARGGAETQVAQLALHLRRRGWDVHIASLIKPSAFVSELAAGGVGVHAPRLLELPLVIGRLRPHIVHSHMFHANLMARLLQAVLPFPVAIATLHSASESSRGSDSTRARDLLYRLTDPWCDVTVGVSQAVVRRHVEAGAVLERKSRVIRNGIDTETFHPPDVPPRNAIFTWLAAGRLMWKKDYPTLLRAFAQVGSGRLLIAGSGPDEASLRALAPPGVEFLGPRSDIPELMRSADAFVLSSVIEGLPLALLEAHASGLPSVATAAGGVPEAKPWRVVPIGDAAALAASMLALMSLSEAERRAAGASAREHAIREFAWPAVVDRWEALYREFLPWT